MRQDEDSNADALQPVHAVPSHPCSPGLFVPGPAQLGVPQSPILSACCLESNTLLRKVSLPFPLQFPFSIPPASQLPINK